MNTTPTPEEKIAKRRRFIVNFAYFVILFGLSVLFVRYALPHLWAFVIALIVVLLLKGPAHWINEHWKIDYKTGAVILVLLFYATIGTGVTFFAVSLVNRAINLIKDIPGFFRTTVSPALTDAVTLIEDKLQAVNETFGFQLEFNLEESVKSAISALTSSLTGITSTIITNSTGIAVSVSTMLLNLVICIVTTAFGLMDYDGITDWFKSQLSPERTDRIGKITGHLGKVIGQYILSYGLIMLITFAELAAGLGIILRDGKAIGIAAVIAVCDILPIIGSGLFLFPWAVIALLSGNIFRGIGLLILWSVLIVVRNFMEPKIVGHSVGMHPLVTLFSMIAGQFIYGGIGILLCPVTLALLQTLNREGIVHLYKFSPSKDEPKKGLARFFEVLGDKISAGFSKAWKAVFKKTPVNVETRIENFAEQEKKAQAAANLTSEYQTGSPEAADCGPRHVGKPSDKNAKPEAATDVPDGISATKKKGKKPKKHGKS